MRLAFFVALCLLLLPCATVAAADYPPPANGTFVISHFHFADGESLANLRLHYVTFGKPKRDATGKTTNAVLVIHGTGGSTKQFVSDHFAGVLFRPGGVLDASRYFIIIPDEIGHGTSSKPSDGLRAKFPHYGYHDMVRATHQLLTDGLHVNHLRLVMGTSLGGMQTWLASQPIEVSGRNRVWRDMIATDITLDPGYHSGNYTTEPHSMKSVEDMLWFVGSAPLYDQSHLPTGAAADAYYRDTVLPRVAHLDANDMLYQIESSRDYNPEPQLRSIVAPLLAINSADDQINPPELGIMQREIKKVPRRHGTHTLPTIWHEYLAELLRESAHE